MIGQLLRLISPGQRHHTRQTTERYSWVQSIYHRQISKEHQQTYLKKQSDNCRTEQNLPPWCIWLQENYLCCILVLGMLVRTCAWVKTPYMIIKLDNLKILTLWKYYMFSKFYIFIIIIMEFKKILTHIKSWRKMHQQLIKSKLLLSVYSQLWVVQYGEFSRWCLVGVEVCQTTNSPNTVHIFCSGQVGRIKVLIYKATVANQRTGIKICPYLLIGGIFNYLIMYSDWLLLTDRCVVIGCVAW